MLGRAIRGLAALLLALVSVTAFAQAPPEASPRVALRTDLGSIVIELDAVHAPVTTANFLHYVDAKRFDGMTFYRAMHLDWGEQPNGLVQGGIGNDPKRAFKPIAHEPTDRTGILHKAGTISMARWKAGTAAGDFFILLSDMPGLDANPQGADDDARTGFAAFGHVVEGMDVVRAIWDAPRSATKGEGVMKGQMIDAPVRIVSARMDMRPPPQPDRVPSPTR